MTTAAERTSQLIEAGGDICNPILVKETRQALKSRQFVATFMLLLAASWLVSTFFMLWASDAMEFGAVAMQLFYLYYVVLAFAVFVVVPFGAYRSLLNENDLNTFDLLSITTLSPRQIVGGKLWTAIVQIFIYYSAIAPFMAFTALLNGFDFALFAFILIVSNFAAVAASMIALTLSAFARRKHWQAITSMALIGGLMSLFAACLGLAGTILSEGLPFDEPVFWWFIAGLVTITFSYMLLCQQITTAQLTFESDNRSTGVRVVASAQVWVYGIALIAYLPNSRLPLNREVVLAFSMLALVHLAVIGFFISTEEDSLSRRVRRGLPRSFGLRFLVAPFMPGGSRGLLYGLIHVGALWLISWQCLLLVPGRGRAGAEVSLFGFPLEAPLPILTTACCYVVIMLGIGSALSRWGRSLSSEVKAAHARVATVLVFAAGMIIPFFPRLLKWVNWRDFSLLDVSNVFLTIEAVFQGGDDGELALTLVVVGTVLILAVNLRAIIMGISDITNSVVIPRRSELEAADASDLGSVLEEPELITDAELVSRDGGAAEAGTTA